MGATNDPTAGRPTVTPAPDGLVEECREWLAAHNGSWAIKGGPVAMPEALAAFVRERVEKEREECAKIVEAARPLDYASAQSLLSCIASAIRQRGEGGR